MPVVCIYIYFPESGRPGTPPPCSPHRSRFPLEMRMWGIRPTQVKEKSMMRVCCPPRSSSLCRHHQSSVPRPLSAKGPALCEWSLPSGYPEPRYGRRIRRGRYEPWTQWRNVSLQKQEIYILHEVTHSVPRFTNLSRRMLRSERTNRIM